MSENAAAVVYVRTDPPESASELDVRRMRRLATRLGYEVREVITATSEDPARLSLLLAAVTQTGAEAVFVSHTDHLDGRLERVVAVADVIVDADRVYARWSPIVEMAGEASFVERVNP